MNAAYYIFLCVMVVPYTSSTILVALGRSSNAVYLQMAQGATWAVLFLPVRIAYWTRVLLLVGDASVANLLLIVMSDALASVDIPYQVTARTLWNLRTWMLLATCCATLLQLLLFTEDFREPSEDSIAESDLDVRSNESFDALSNAAVETYTFIIAVATGVASVITSAIYRYAVPSGASSVYSAPVILALVSASFAASVLLRVIPSPWGLIVHRCVVNVAFFVCLIARNAPPRRSYGPLRKEQAGGVGAGAVLGALPPPGLQHRSVCLGRYLPVRRARLSRERRPG